MMYSSVLACRSLSHERRITYSVTKKFMALLRFVWVFSQSLGLIKAGKNRTGGAETLS
jgi:hypothetical protein